MSHGTLIHCRDSFCLHPGPSPNTHTHFLASEIFDFALTDEDSAILDNMAQKLTIMERSTIQHKIDNPLPDGYKLKMVKIPAEP